MFANQEEEIKAIRTKTVKIQLMGIPGAIFIGLALYAIFAANGKAFHPALNNMNFVYAMLIVGIIIELVQFAMLIPLWKRLAQLRKQV